MIANFPAGDRKPSKIVRAKRFIILANSYQTTTSFLLSLGDVSSFCGEMVGRETSWWRNEGLSQELSIVES